MINELFGLDGKSALVVGASKGLGKAMALALAEAGADVAVSSRSQKLIEEVRDDIIASGRQAIAVKADISREDDIISMTGQVIDYFGKIDILVNNAGIYIPAAALDMTAADWDKTLNINLKGFFLSCKTVGRHMADRKSGKIINIASVLGKRSAQRSSAYSASKAAIIQLTKSLAFELSPYNIKVNAIAPGWFETELVENELENPTTRTYFLSKTPLRKFGVPKELGGTIVFLASKASDFITGETITIDGGYSIC